MNLILKIVKWVLKAVLPALVSPESVAKKLPPIYPGNELFLSHLARSCDCIAITDLQVGIIMEFLEKDGLLDNTIVFLLSDHGSDFP